MGMAGSDDPPCTRTTPADRAALVESHQRFAVWVVRTFYPRLRGPDREDAVAAAYLGLVLAAERFDPTRGSEFRHYAIDWCRQCVSRQRAADRRRGMRRVPADGPGKVASLDAPAG